MAGLGARVGDAYASDTEPTVGGAAGVGFEPGGGAVGAEVARNEPEFHHSMKRRCFAHDYRARSIYMVTLEVKGRRPLLGRICPEKLKSLACGRLSEEEVIEHNQGFFEPSEIGRLVEEEFMKIGEHVPGVKPLLAQAMPDHFHGIVFVTRAINRSLGSIMAGFKGKCSSLATALRRGHRTGAGDALAAFETPEFAAKRAELFDAAKKGAVLCSPCISDGEKAIAYAAVDAGHSLIVLRNEPFPPMFKPSGRFFDACAEGRLLLLYCDGLTTCVPARRSITRSECLALNALVAEICGGMGGDICYHGMTDLRGTVS